MLISVVLLLGVFATPMTASAVGGPVPTKFDLRSATATPSSFSAASSLDNDGTNDTLKERARRAAAKMKHKLNGKFGDFVANYDAKIKTIRGKFRSVVDGCGGDLGNASPAIFVGLRTIFTLVILCIGFSFAQPSANSRRDCNGEDVHEPQQLSPQPQSPRQLHRVEEEESPEHDIDVETSDAAATTGENWPDDGEEEEEGVVVGATKSVSYTDDDDDTVMLPMATMPVAVISIASCPVPSSEIDNRAQNETSYAPAATSGSICSDGGALESDDGVKLVERKDSASFLGDELDFDMHFGG